MAPVFDGGLVLLTQNNCLGQLPRWLPDGETNLHKDSLFTPVYQPDCSSKP